MRDNRGITLVETIIALTIFLLVVTSVMVVYTNGYSSYILNNQRIEVQENLRIALNRMSRDIRQASEYITIYEQDENLSTDGSGPKIKFKNASGVVVEYSYDPSGKEVEVRKGTGGSPLPLASHIVGLEFQYDQGKKIVTILIQGQKASTNPPVVYELSTRVRARAL